MHDRILILDFGSQVTQLIARRVREAHVYCEIHPNDVSDAFIRQFAPKGIILSGSHGSTYEGVGVGGSPAAALASCCNNGGAVLEEGVAQGRDGRWYACRRYSQR